MKPTLKCLITRGMAFIFFALFGQSVWAASLFFDNSTDPSMVAVSAGQFEGGFSVNGAPLASGATVAVAETANSCVVSYAGDWIDLDDAATVDRTIYFVDTVDPAIVTDILVFDVVTGATVTGTWTSDACGALPPVPGGTPAGDVVPADGTSVGISAAYLLGNASARVAEADLSMTATDTPDPVLAGSGVPGNLTHVITINNVGPDSATGVEVDMTFGLPTGVSIESVTAPPPTVYLAGGIWDIGDLAVGGTYDLTVVLTVDAAAADCTDCVSVQGTATANERDSTPGNDTIDSLTSIETAAGGGSTTFPVTIDFSNDFDGSVMVSLTCNTGNPLSQEFEITEAGGVDFVVQVLDFIAPTTTCEVSLTDIDGAYISNAMLANGVDTGSSCVFSGTPVADESAAFDPDRSNTCEIAAEPIPNVWTVSKVWLDGGSDISQEATFDWDCTNASQTTDGSAAGFGGSFTETGDFDDVEVTVYPAPGMTATCSATEDLDLLDDSVESDQGCASGNEFTIGSGDDGCTITNSVFYEGIPSLNQYGLALMALLMLGVGMVGFRRFA